MIMTMNSLGEKSSNSNNKIKEAERFRLERWKRLIGGVGVEEKDDGGKINNKPLEKQIAIELITNNINTSTKIINTNSTDDRQCSLNDDEFTRTTTKTTISTCNNKKNNNNNNNNNNSNQIKSQLNASQLESSTSNITSQQSNNNNVANNKDFVFLRYNNNNNKSESSYYDRSSSFSSSLAAATTTTTNLDNRCYCIDCKGSKNGRQELRTSSKSDDDDYDDEEHEKQLVELVHNDHHNNKNNNNNNKKHDKSIISLNNNVRPKKPTRKNKITRFNNLNSTSAENNNNTLSQTTATLNNHILVPINTRDSMTSRIVPRMTLTFLNEQESEIKRSDCECHFGSEMMMLNEPTARSMILDYTESSSPRSCFDSSNGSSSIISNLSSTSSSNNSTNVAAALTNRSNEFDDDEDAFEVVVLGSSARKEDDNDVAFKAFDNLTYLSSHEDLTTPTTNPIISTTRANTNRNDEVDEDDDEPQFNFVGDLLVKKTLKSIKRKDKLKKEAKSNLFNSSSINQSMPDLKQTQQFQSNAASAVKLSRSKSMASSTSRSNMRRKCRSLDDLIFSGSDDDEDEQLRLVRRSSRNSSLASTSQVSEVSITSSVFYRQMGDAWSPDISSESDESSQNEIFDKDFDWDSDFNLSTNASHSSSQESSDEEEFDSDKIEKEMKDQSCLEIVNKNKTNESEINEMFNPNVKLSPNLLDKMLNDVLSNLLENYPILKDVLSCSKAKNLSNLNLHFFQITNENIKTISTNCFICSTAFDLQEEAVSLSCKHLYHKICLQFWLTKAYSCPLCELSCLNSKNEQSESSSKKNVAALAIRETLL